MAVKWPYIANIKKYQTSHNRNKVAIWILIKHREMTNLVSLSHLYNEKNNSTYFIVICKLIKLIYGFHCVLNYVKFWVHTQYAMRAPLLLLLLPWPDRERTPKDLDICVPCRNTQPSLSF